MARPLMIDANKQAEITEAVKRAEAHPIPFAVLQAGAVTSSTHDIKLKDRKPGFERPASESVLIPIGFRAAFSVEEQPVGLCYHLSISVDRVGKLPHEMAVKIIADAYGLTRWDSVWLEEFDVGHQAVNILMVKVLQ